MEGETTLEDQPIALDTQNHQEEEQDDGIRRKIRFYKEDGPYGCFSNFSPHAVTIGGKSWKTSEHYFQAMKFVGTRYEEEIRAAKTPGKAATMGRSKSKPLRPDWEQVKDSIMKDVVFAKFTQHKDLKKTLLGTADAILIEHTERDSYWGDGGNGKGRNQLGKTLMMVRDEICKLEGLTPEDLALLKEKDYSRTSHQRNKISRAFVDRDGGLSILPTGNQDDCEAGGFHFSEKALPAASRHLVKGRRAKQMAERVRDFESEEEEDEEEGETRKPSAYTLTLASGRDGATLSSNAFDSEEEEPTEEPNEESEPMTSEEYQKAGTALLELYRSLPDEDPLKGDLAQRAIQLLGGLQEILSQSDDFSEDLFRLAEELSTCRINK